MSKSNVKLSDGVADNLMQSLNNELSEIGKTLIELISEFVKERIRDIDLRELFSKKDEDKLLNIWYSQLVEKGLIPKVYEGLPEDMLIHNLHQEGYLQGMYVGFIELVQQFGFELYGTKGDGIYKENVYLKEMRKITGNINKDFPLVCISTAKKYLLSIYPKYHSVMFPDSILNTEDKNIITDISYTNSIHKVYVCTMDQVENLKYGDIVVLYRTAETGRSAEYSAVATSICVVEDVKKQSEFDSFDDFYRYVSKYSVFDEDDLRYWYNKGGCKAIKMTYNGALKKRIVRHDLIGQIGLERNQYWGFFELTDEEFNLIAKKGEVDKILVQTN